MVVGLTLLNIAATIVIAVASSGGGLAVAISNVLPLVLGYSFLVTLSLRRTIRPAIRALLSAYVAGSAGVDLLVGVFWLFDVYGFKTGSSTSGLVFAFAPAWSLVLGVTCMVGVFLAVLAWNAVTGRKIPLF